MADFIMEEREEEIVIPSTGRTIFRKAHFLKPSLTSIDDSVEAPPPHYSLNNNNKPTYKKVPFTVNFYKLQNTPRKWGTWVRNMKPLHHLTWKKAGIYDAIVSSTSNIRRDESLIYGFVEKWCPVTNTFVFPWGEATVTLEDMIVLGGYSVLGDSVLIAPSDSEMEETVKKLRMECSKITKTKVNKACQSAWMKEFMNSRSEIEHEAFLAYWLSRFVFPRPTIDTRVLSIAVHLSQGVKIALAPAVLARIYQNMSLLKAAMDRRIGNRGECDQKANEVIVSAPLALVQVWIWERFPNLRPISNTKPNETRMAQWHNLKKLKIEDLSLKIDSAAEIFEWRPYVTATDSFFHMKIYVDKEYWASVETDLDEELEGLIRCLRTSELVGLEANCIEQYLPQRVAMQFGINQDLPGHVARENLSPRIAWSNYSRQIKDKTVYVPPRLFVPGVTTRYLKWWKEIYCCLDSTTVKDTTSGSEEILEVMEDDSRGKETEINCGVNGIAVVDWKSRTEEILVNVREDLLGQKKEKTGGLNGMTALDGKVCSMEILIEVRKDDSLEKEKEINVGLSGMAAIYRKSNLDDILVEVPDVSIGKKTEDKDSVPCRSNEIEAALHGKTSFKSSKMIFIKSEDSFEDVPPGFSPKRKRAIATSSGGSGIFKPLNDGRNFQLSCEEFARNQSPSSYTPTRGKIGVHGKCSFMSSNMISIEDCGDSQSQDVGVQSQIRTSSTEDNGTSMLEVDNTLQNKGKEQHIDGELEIGVTDDHIQSSITREPGLRLEARVIILERLMGLLKTEK